MTFFKLLLETMSNLAFIALIAFLMYAFIQSNKKKDNEDGESV